MFVSTFFNIWQFFEEKSFICYEGNLYMSGENLNISTNSVSLSYNPLTARDYKIDNVRQGGIDSCYMLSSLSARKDDIEKSGCMKWNKDGSCDVSLYDVKPKEPKLTIMGAFKNLFKGNYSKDRYETGERKTFNITDAELKQTDFKVTDNGKSKTIKLSNSEDITAKAMEIAMIKYHGNEVGFQTFAGTLEKEQKMLYGKNAPEVKETWAGRIKPDQISKSATCMLPVKGSLLSGSAAKDYVNARDNSGDITVKDVNNKPIKIFDQHAYTVNGYDKKNDTVSISNPHSNDLNSTKDDIVLPFKTFKNLFNIEYIDK